MTPTSDPAAIPPLLAAPAPARPGRSRSTFTLHPTSTTGASAATPGAETSGAETAGVNGHRNGTLAVKCVRPGPRDLVDGSQGLDWALVTAFRTLVADRLAQALGDWATSNDVATSATRTGRGVGERAAQEELGWSIIDDLLSEHTADAVKTGQVAWTPAQRAKIGQAIFDAVFRLGRLQPLVDDDRVENIFILGHDRVLLELVDGSRVPGASVADSDAELIDFLRFLANRSESNPRPFSESHPRLHMKLDGGARLAATAWVVSRPSVVIRRHRLRVDSLNGWVDRGCMSSACASFLAAVVRASWSIAVSGPMSAGKTTLMRALCAQIPADEAIGTFETEYELFLDQAGTHEVVIDWEARPGCRGGRRGRARSGRVRPRRCVD